MSNILAIFIVLWFLVDPVVQVDVWRSNRLDFLTIQYKLAINICYSLLSVVDFDKLVSSSLTRVHRAPLCMW